MSFFKSFFHSETKNKTGPSEINYKVSLLNLKKFWEKFWETLDKKITYEKGVVGRLRSD